jgi:hypothetical protein
MSTQVKIRDKPLAAAPAADDVVLLDGVVNGVRALPASYFPTTFALASTCKPLVAGSGVVLTDNGTTITVDFA